MAVYAQLSDIGHGDMSIRGVVRWCEDEAILLSGYVDDINPNDMLSTPYDTALKGTPNEEIAGIIQRELNKRTYGKRK